MRAPYKRVAVIGAGPSGLAAVRALKQENIFEYVRVFERKSCVGGLWAYEAEPDKFQPASNAVEKSSDIPSSLGLHNPCFTPPCPKRPGLGNASYETLDTNAGARTMSFTHTPLPIANSAGSLRRYGPGNSTRPRSAVLQYIEELFAPSVNLISFETHVERIEKKDDGKWLLTLRRENIATEEEGLTVMRDYWWQDLFDAVVVASGHFTVASVPEIEGLAETWAKYPEKFEHSKSWRSPEHYADKKVVVVGGGISAADLAEELHGIVKGPLYISRRGEVGFLEEAWALPNIVSKPTIIRITSAEGGTLEFADGSTVSRFDKIIFATGYKLSYPFLPFNAVTPQNRLAGFYQHVFRIGDPSLAVIGQVRAAISFRIYEYQAVAVARFLAGRSQSLPAKEEQEEWERTRVEHKGPTELFHEIKPDFFEYYGWLRDFAGPPAEGTEGYILPEFKDEWVDSDVEVLIAKGKYWAALAQAKQCLPPSKNGAINA